MIQKNITKGAAMKTDARVRYTRMIIQQTFLKLLKEKPIAKITVKEICELAEINRTTFYKHYSDPYDLLKQLELEAIHGLLSVIEDMKDNDPARVLLPILCAIQKNRELFHHLTSAQSDNSFLYRLAASCFRKICELAPKETGCGNADPMSVLRFSYIAGGIAGVIEYWLQSGMNESPEAIADKIWQFTASVVG